MEKIKGTNIKGRAAVNPEESIREHMMQRAVCLMDSQYIVKGIGSNSVNHMDKCSHSGLISMQVKKSVCLYDKSQVYCSSEENEFIKNRSIRNLPIKSILSLPNENACMKYSCFNPTDANLMFAGCDQGQLHLYDLNECTKK